MARLPRFLGSLFLFYLVSLAVYEAYWRLGPPTSWDAYKGDWALITGSSYGIGRSFALELASKGINVLIHGRSQSKLDSLSKEIVTKFPNVQVKAVVQDVVEAPNWDKVAELVKGLDVTILVNNVGGGSLDGSFTRIHERTLEYHQKIHNFNFGATIGWSSILLPKMVELKRGRIMSCSSLAYLFGYGESVYGADKGAINSFTLNLNNEYLNDGIRAESLVIGIVSTPAMPMEADYFGYVESSERIARNALNLFGWKEIYAPGFTHSFFHLIGTSLPTSLRVNAAKDGTENVVEFAKKGRETINNNKKEL